MDAGLGTDLGRVVLAFPGQGSQEDGLRELVERWRPELLDTLDAVVDGDAFAAAGSSTAAAQPAIVCASIARWRALGSPEAGYVVGHSLGEITALVAAGSLDEHDAIRLAARRGALMQEASDAHPGCGMLAARAALREVEPIADESGVAVGNHNAPTQVVLSGSAHGLDRARELLKAAGIRSTRLPVAGAFHSPLMESAVEPFRTAVEALELAPQRSVVYSPLTVRPMIDARRELPDSLLSPVRFMDTIRALADEGAERFVEVGPGRVLSKLIELSLAPVFDRARD
jgi:[acyl-carrier-protein] S-malonyltransferase